MRLTMSSRFIHFAAYDRISFFLNNIPFCVYIYHMFCIHSSISEHLGFSHLLAILNNEAINIFVKIPFKILVSTILDVYPEADCCVTWWFCFLRSLHAVSLAAALFHIPPNGTRGSGFQSLHSLVSSRYFCLLVFQ